MSLCCNSGCPGQAWPAPYPGSFSIHRQAQRALSSPHESHSVVTIACTPKCKAYDPQAGLNCEQPLQHVEFDRYQTGSRGSQGFKRLAASNVIHEPFVHSANVFRLETSTHARTLAHMQCSCSNLAAACGSQRGHIAGCIACHARPVIAVAAIGRPPLQAARLQLPQVSKPLPQRRHRSRCAQATSQAQPE